MGKRAEIRQLQDQAEELTVNDFLGIRSVLTKDQLQMLPQLRPGSAGKPPIDNASTLGSASATKSGAEAQQKN